MPIRKDLRPLYRTLEWKAAREACKLRAQDRCEQCGQPNGTTAELVRGGKMRAVKIQCGCAHLNHKAGDNRPENLAWLCRACHLHTDRAKHRDSRAGRKDRARPVLTLALQPVQVSLDEMIETIAKETIYEN